MTVPIRLVLAKRQVLARPESGPGGEPDRRVVHVDPRQGAVWLMRTDGVGWPERASSRTIEDELVAGFLVPASVTSPRSLDGAGSSQADLRRWNLLEPLVRDDDALEKLLDPDVRGRTIAAYVGEVRTLDPASKVSRQQICALLKRFLARGMTPAAVATDYARCGGRGKPRELGDRKVGRPRSPASEPGINATNLVRQHMLLGALMVQRRRGDLRDGYNEVVATYYRNVDGEVSADRPSYEQFAYFYRTRFPDQVRRRARMGDARFELTARALRGRADQDAVGPGSRFTIDSTTADMFLVSEFNRAALVGRPTLYLVSDDFSHMIVGMYASFEPPSWEGAMMALLATVEDKQAFCARYGVVVAADEWPCAHLPRTLAADRGEMISEHADGVAKRLRFRMATAGAGRGDMKSICERDFGSVQREFGEYMPGYVEKDFGTRDQEQDYRRHAKFTLSEYYDIIINSILEHNHSPIPKRAPLPEMVAAGLTSSPIDFWNYGLAARSGRLRVFAPEEVALKVLRRDKATVDAYGVRFERGYYISGAAAALGWSEMARASGTFDIDVAYDPRSLDTIILLHPDVPGNRESLALNDALSGAHRGKSLSEVRQFYAQMRAVERRGGDARLTSTLKRRDHVKAVTVKATQLTDLAQRDGPSAPQRIKRMPDDRREERARNRQADALTAAPSPPRALPVARPEAAPDQVGALESRQDRLAREQRERRARRRTA